jgi:hypothetical protein
MLSEETIKQVFFYCDHHEPNAIVADDVDIVQFANRISEVTAVEVARKEHARCVALVKELNRVVGEKLETLRPL